MDTPRAAVQGRTPPTSPSRSSPSVLAGIHCRRDASDHRPVGEGERHSRPPIPEGDRPLPRRNADPLDPLPRNGVTPPSGNSAQPSPALQTDTARPPRRWLRPLLDPDPLGVPVRPRLTRLRGSPRHLPKIPHKIFWRSLSGRPRPGRPWVQKKGNRMSTNDTPIPAG